MSRNFKILWVVPAALLVLAVACASSDEPEPIAVTAPPPTPAPTETPVVPPAIDLDALSIDVADLDALGLTETDIQCLSVQVEAELITQLLTDNSSLTAVLSVAPALQVCGVDLANLIESADRLYAERAGEGFEGLDSLPFTAEQLACVVLTVDADLLESLVGGDLDPAQILPVLSVFNTCGVELADLITFTGDGAPETNADDDAADDHADLPSITDIPGLPGSDGIPGLPGIPSVPGDAGFRTSRTFRSLPNNSPA
ncbi:MAG: hypothetical protein O3C10_08415 [Chloroflexi bacterium]|nr:hypothetical protein [Chloroflexota bacterium]